jgi:hypothetical protein
VTGRGELAPTDTRERDAMAYQAATARAERAEVLYPSSDPEVAGVLA